MMTQPSEGRRERVRVTGNVSLFRGNDGLYVKALSLSLRQLMHGIGGPPPYTVHELPWPRHRCSVSLLNKCSLSLSLSLSL